MRYVNATLKAAFLFNKNVHYLVRGQEVLLIDEHTGRTMPGRRMSEGIHQALECKENVAIQKESQTLASTTYQNFFRLFNISLIWKQIRQKWNCVQLWSFFVFL